MIKKLIISFVLAFSLFGCASSNTENSETVEIKSENLTGSYQDRTSQRATMEINKEGDSFHILVHWSDSAEEYEEWEMNASLDETKLNYSNCTKKLINGEQSTTDYENGTGYFEWKDGVLYWTGASDESCQDCAFEKID